MQRNWGYLPFDHNSRAALITAKLPPLRPKPLRFPCAAPTSHLGAWTLLGYDRMLVSPTQTSPFVNGAVAFEEDRVGPPSRAYLKLWEACTLWRAWPQPGETCLDLGAAPGGWTWALAKLGARVVAIDKAALEPAIAAMPGVSVRQEERVRPRSDGRARGGLVVFRRDRVSVAVADPVCRPGSPAGGWGVSCAP